MRCVDKRELEQFLRGKLDPERLMSVDEHVSACAECKSALESLPGRTEAAASLGDALLSLADCPEYEELSSFVDNTLAALRAKQITVHLNSCEPCTADVARIRELRSHTAMRQKVTVAPGMARGGASSTLGLWQRALAAVGVAGALAVVAVSMGYFGKGPAPQTVAVKPPSVEQPANKGVEPPIGTQPGTTKTNIATAPKPGANTAKPGIVAQKPVAPAVNAVLRDGKYRVIKHDGGYAVAKVDGKIIKTPLEARIAASIDEKIRTGKIKPMKSVVVAMNDIRLRAGGYTPPATAPKPVEPAGRMVLGTQPTLTWSEVDLAQAYRVRVTDNDGSTVYEGNAEGTRTTLDKPLERGRLYKWQVGVRFSESDAWAWSKAAGFKVLSSDDLASIRRIQSTMPGSHLALGAAYESMGLYDEARAEYRALRRDNPSSQLARRLLSETSKAGQ